jgi:two-component system LytT family response regulator
MRVTSQRVAIAFWTMLATLALIQRLAVPALRASAAQTEVLRTDGWLLALWALATPGILWLGRRFPLRRSQLLHSGLVQLAAATVFIVLSNVIARLPALLGSPGHGWSWLFNDATLGLVQFYPAALLLFGVLALVGQHTGALSASIASAGDDQAQSVNTSLESAPASNRVVVREWNRVHLVRPEDISWIEADDNYVVVHAAGRIYKGRGKIGELESQLDARTFARIHRSAIVRLACIREVQPLTKGDLAVILGDGKVLRVARSRRSAFERALGVPVSGTGRRGQPLAGRYSAAR